MTVSACQIRKWLRKGNTTGAGHIFCTDLKAGIEAAVGCDSFRIREPPGGDDMYQPGYGSRYPHLWRGGQHKHLGTG